MRRAICRILGHRWRNVRAWDVNGWPSWWCQRCHVELLTPRAPGGRR